MFMTHRDKDIATGPSTYILFSTSNYHPHAMWDVALSHPLILSLILSICINILKVNYNASRPQKKEFISSDNLHNPSFPSLLKTHPVGRYLLLLLNYNLFSANGDFPRPKVLSALWKLWWSQSLDQLDFSSVRPLQEPHLINPTLPSFWINYMSFNKYFWILAMHECLWKSMGGTKNEWDMVL